MSDFSLTIKDRLASLNLVHPIKDVRLIIRVTYATYTGSVVLYGGFLVLALIFIVGAWWSDRAKRKEVAEYRRKQFLRYGSFRSDEEEDFQAVLNGSDSSQDMKSFETPPSTPSGSRSPAASVEEVASCESNSSTSRSVTPRQRRCRGCRKKIRVGKNRSRRIMKAVTRVKRRVVRRLDGFLMAAMDSRIYFMVLFLLSDYWRRIRRKHKWIAAFCPRKAERASLPQTQRAAALVISVLFSFTVNAALLRTGRWSHIVILLV